MMRIVVLPGALAVVLSGAVVAVAQTVRPPGTVVFVCEHGAVKSVVAAALFNRLAIERGVPFRAISRGTDPDSAVPATVRHGLEAEGLNIDPMFAPARVAAADLAGAARVVVFDVALLPAVAPGARVEELLRELRTRQ